MNATTTEPVDDGTLGRSATSARSPMCALPLRTMHLSEFSAPFVRGADAAVIEVLSRSDAGPTGRRVAQLAELPESTCRLALGRLTNHGLIDVREVGRAHLFRLNRSHISWPTAELALSTRRRLFRRYADLVQSHGDNIDLVLLDHVKNSDPVVRSWRRDGLTLAGRPLDTILQSIA